jgi:2-succinyl-5-enolpyruvyl-6-hydroxy-3-cyclohexene-1-carboxylate synthase
VRLQPIYDIAEICSQHGITDAVVCPGSRCAPLTISFSRHPKIKVKTFSDERSAAFIALGLAQQTKKPVVLICTSGSAAYNFSPAVAEAFYNHVPLIILTADRPKEWINQLDGQTIQQREIYGAHVKKYFELPADYDHADSVWFIHRSINEAIHLSKQELQGPVHVNIPLREPLYPAKNEEIQFSKEIRIISDEKIITGIGANDWEFIKQQWLARTKVLIVGGQAESNEPLVKHLNFFTTLHSAVLVGDVISNLHGLNQTIRYADSFLAHGGEEVKQSLQPDILITFGRSVISKNLKLFLRKYKPAQHWHIQSAGEVADTFQSLTRVIRCDETLFFEQLSQLPTQGDFEKQKRDNYFRLWQVQEHKTERNITEYFSTKHLSEFHLTHEVIRSLPSHSNLHLANSMTVRYANFIGLKPEQGKIKIYSNRGTSGIDGCTSTTIGHSFGGDQLNILITGDLAFFYDRNAFWHNYPLLNLRIVLLNNHGGVIFGMIDGPGELPEAEEFFITRQKLSAKNICQEFGIEYARIDNTKKIKNVLNDFYELDGRPKLIEIETDSNTSKQAFEQFKQLIKRSYEA